ncbi:MAG: hypothetical protein PWQ37_2935 [Candidatus Petromonas sp.]|jgi:septal ring factor EnvC (AmiA/AmiB activator)|nr:hypothetical protein [Candidatus Petromonas sp.]
MENSLHSESYKSKRVKGNKNKGKRIWINILLFIISIGLWGTIVYYGYINAKAYIDDSINRIEQNNAMAVQQLKEEMKIINSEIKRLRSEIKDLKEEVRDADSTLTNSNDIQEGIDKKLKYLDDKLKDLQESLDILKEAPNVEN